MSELVVGAVQMTSSDDVESNLERASDLVREAASAGALLVGLPENFAYLGDDRDHRLSIAERLPSLGPGESGVPPTVGPILSAMRELARGAGTWLLLGGFPERADDGARIRNSAILLDPAGTVVAIYRKIHLFDVDVPGGKRYRESEAIEPGADTVVATTPWGGLGLSICYDPDFRSSTVRWRPAARESRPSRRPSRSRPARTTGTRCCGRGRSRTSSTSSRRRSSAPTGRRGGATDTPWWSTRGARSSPNVATTRGSRWPRSISAIRIACARRSPASCTDASRARRVQPAAGSAGGGPAGGISADSSAAPVMSPPTTSSERASEIRQ
jgi:hypothetical protein